MKGDIEKMLDEIDDFKKDYYQKIIGLHNNSRLRNLSVQCDKNYGFTIFKKDDSSDWLVCLSAKYKSKVFIPELRCAEPV